MFNIGNDLESDLDSINVLNKIIDTGHNFLANTPCKFPNSIGLLLICI